MSRVKMNPINNLPMRIKITSIQSTLLAFALALLLLVAACAPDTPQPAPGAEEGLPVVATTSIVADVVRQVGGERISVSVLLPLGIDPHAYEPAPQDVARLSGAQLIFANGAGLEEFLPALLENAGAANRLVEVSSGIELIEFAQEHGAEDAHEEEDEHEEGDPHTWVDPNLVIIWVENIRAALAAADPVNAAVYAANAAAYQAELRALDSWVREQVETIPPGNRKIVTDHLVFGYFAERYGFEQVGAIIPGYSTLAAPSAQEIAAIEDAIREFGVKAVFVGESVNPSIAQRIAEDTGVRLVPLYHGSLSEPGGPADSYLTFIRYNVSAIVEALK